MFDAKTILLAVTQLSWGCFTRALSIATFAMVATLCPAWAGDSITLLPAQKGWVARIAEAVQKIQSSRSDFEQVGPDGSRARGHVWIARPGKMRFAFDKPSSLLIVANHGKLIYQDKDLGQVTTLPLDRTPLSVLLQDQVAFIGAVTITNYQDDGARIHLTVVQSDRPDEGSLTLIVQKAPLAVLGWSVVDAQGKVTSVALSHTQTGVALPHSLFDLPQSSD